MTARGRLTEPRAVSAEGTWPWGVVWAAAPTDRSAAIAVPANHLRVITNASVRNYSNFPRRASFARDDDRPGEGLEGDQGAGIAEGTANGTAAVAPLAPPAVGSHGHGKVRTDAPAEGAGVELEPGLRGQDEPDVSGMGTEVVAPAPGQGGTELDGAGHGLGEEPLDV